MRAWIMMAFSTLCCKNTPPERRWRTLGACVRALVLGVCLAPVCWSGATALANEAAAASTAITAVGAGADATPLQLERSDEALLLSASLHFGLPAQVEEALLQGIPMYFNAEAEVLRERWYWRNQRIALAQRFWRLSYQPLTRRWQLHMAHSPFVHPGLGIGLGQYFESYEEALAALQRLLRWKIADLSEMATDNRVLVQLRFKLDLSQLPRPLQISALGPRSGWNLLVARSQVLQWEGGEP